MNDPILALVVPLGGGFNPVDPGFGHPGGGGHIDNSLPPADPAHPWLPSHRPPQIDNSLPIPPLPPALNPPPAEMWPPRAPIFPGTPENPIEVPPGSVWPPLPVTEPGQKVLVLVYITGHGWHWVVLDPGALPPDEAEQPPTTKPTPTPPPAPKA